MWAGPAKNEWFGSVTLCSEWISICACKMAAARTSRILALLSFDRNVSVFGQTFLR